MEKVKLGNSDILASRITIGCWSFGGGDYWGDQSQKDVDNIVNYALDHGINTFDTAEAYNEGESERSLGLALNKRRKEAIIMTKIKPSNCKNVRKYCINSLQRLRTDYLDVYMLHWPINELSLKHFTKDSVILNTPPTIEEAYHEIDKLKKEGLVRSVGFSNFGCLQMAEVINLGINPDINEITYNIVSRAIEKEIVSFCNKFRISIVGSMGLQQGLLTGKYRNPENVPKYQAHSRHFSNIRGQGISRHGEQGVEKEIFELIFELQSISKELGVSLSQLSIKWILKKPFIASTIVGVRNIQQLKHNMDAFTFSLPNDIEKRIDKLSQPILDKLGNSPDYYEHRTNSRIY